MYAFLSKSARSVLATRSSSRMFNMDARPLVTSLCLFVALHEVLDAAVPRGRFWRDPQRKRDHLNASQIMNAGVPVTKSFLKTFPISVRHHVRIPNLFAMVLRVVDVVVPREWSWGGTQTPKTENVFLRRNANVEQLVATPRNVPSSQSLQLV